MRKHFIAIFLFALFLVLTGAPKLYAAQAASSDAPVTVSNDKWGFPHREGIVLVLSGGGTKGLSHVGVLKIFEEEHIPIAAIVGTSMGSIMGGLYAAGYSADDMKELLSKVDLMELISGRKSTQIADLNNSQQPQSGKTLFSLQIDKNGKSSAKLGLMKAKDLYAFLSELTANVTVTDFDLLKYPFAAIATDIETGNTVVMRDGNLASAMRASMSIPGLFDPWERDGKWLVDGGLKANLPVIEAKKLFPGHPVVAVNLSPEDITKSINRMNSVLDIGAQTLEILMVGQVRANAAAADILISPQVAGFGVLDSGGYDKIMERGESAARPCVNDIKALLAEYHAAYSASSHSMPATRPAPPIVKVLTINGLPEHMAHELYESYDDWLDKPLDMKAVAEAVKQVTARSDIKSVESHIKNISRGTVEVVLTMQRTSKYELGLEGYTSNINPDRWAAISAQVRDILSDGDSASIEYRNGTHWGGMMKYYTPLDLNDSQFGFVLSAREEGLPSYGNDDFHFERYSARAMWYKTMHNEDYRIGLGYAVSTANTGDERTLHGPRITLGFNMLDDPIVPSRGFALLSDIWIPIDNHTVSQTAFQLHIPVSNTWKLALTGGLKTGDADDIAYAAILGNENELLSLASHPLVGDEAYWLTLGITRRLMKSWWGGINTTFFGTYGQVLEEWSSSASSWEVGIDLSIPTNVIPGRLFLVYGEDDDFQIGYSIGTPKWWKGPLP